MRAFIAIELPGDVKDYLFDLQKDINKFGKFKWVAKKNLHLTLKFFPDIEEWQLRRVKEKLKEIKFKKFEVRLNKVGVFPNENFIRVVWVDVKPDEDIINLQRRIDEDLLEMFPRDQRFYAHLTLGRAKIVKDKKGLIEALNKKIEQREFEINAIKIMESNLTKDGPIYTCLETYNLE